MGELSLEEMSMKSVRGIFFGGFWVEELALDAIEYGDQDKWNEEDALQFKIPTLKNKGKPSVESALPVPLVPMELACCK
ncbi:hypothetical protein Tco_1168069 [Tanacetum coccineum]